MKGKFLLVSILTYVVISRFFLIDKIPQVLNQSIINLRVLSLCASLISTILVFYLIKNSFGNTKIALISAWAFSVLPWVFEQGRIKSGPNLALGLILFILYLLQKGVPKLKLSLAVLIPIAVFLVYPQFWLFRMDGSKITFDSIVNNLFILFSFDFLFFKNITFWWGGIREFGIMLLSFLPFFLAGIYLLIIQKKITLLLLYIGIAIVSALSPFFPESREFYFITPLISLITALGMHNWNSQKSRGLKLILFCFIILILYELFQFYHFYFIHYPKQVISNISQIHEPF